MGKSGKHLPPLHGVGTSSGAEILILDGSPSPTKAMSKVERSGGIETRKLSSSSSEVTAIPSMPAGRRSGGHDPPRAAQDGAGRAIDLRKMKATLEYHVME